MRFMMIAKAANESEGGGVRSEELLAEMRRYSRQLVEAGVLLASEGLFPGSEGVRIRFAGKERTVIDGPFDETTEPIAGFWLVQVRSKEEVLEWARRCPYPMQGVSEIEIRQCCEPNNSGDERTGEL